ncbi:hypothetical protein POM88_054307 [Heracleum sosnowskyi]|uniref:Uncharacterized protein n=1 Tax=Heracleum sosnowskyi TaxID=360622 RepID=A0AAD8GMI8_9APIA|nr:hypothetical protein POM88_054307 [Heracleum sosnowskyi]
MWRAYVLESVGTESGGGDEIWGNVCEEGWFLGSKDKLYGPYTVSELRGNASGSASSNSVGRVSTKCVANMSSDQDCVITSQEDERASQKKEQPAKKQKVLTSVVWEHFIRITSETKEGKKKIDAICTESGGGDEIWGNVCEEGWFLGSKDKLYGPYTVSELRGNASSSASSNSVGMVSTKCFANMSSDQDCVITSQEGEMASQKKEQPTKKQKVLTSTVWEHFNRITSETKEVKKKIDAICTESGGGDEIWGNVCEEGWFLGSKDKLYGPYTVSELRG